MSLNFAHTINATFYSKYLEVNRLEAVNWGQCFDWAYYAYCLYPISLWTTDHHAWVELGGMYYDSEAPSGRLDFMKLGCNARSGWERLSPRKVSAHYFQGIWNQYGCFSQGGLKPGHWKKLIANIKNAGLTPIRM